MKDTSDLDGDEIIPWQHKYIFLESFIGGQILLLSSQNIK